MKKASEDLPKKSRKKIIFLILVLIVLIIAAVLGFYFFSQYQKGNLFGKYGQSAGAKDNNDLVAKVGKIYKLPNETPSVATVSDITKLRNQTLFQNAQNGDKVLIFNKAKRAIVYRPSENMIIEVGNIVVSPEGSSPSVSPQASKKVKVVLYNGTDTAGYAKSVGSSLTSKFPNIEVAGTQNAVNGYQKTLVVDLTGKNESFAKSLATELKGSVDDLPDGEDKPNSADILIILGK